MKRFACIFTVITLLLSSLCLPVAAAPKLNTVTLNVYNWGQYISDGSDELPDTNELFEDYFNQTLAEKYGYRIKVNYSTYPSNEDMYNKIVSGSASFDVVVPSDYMIERMILEGLLQKLDFEKIPLLSNIDEAFLNGKYNTYDPDALYSVPYTYSMVGVIYNTEYVDEADTGSWSLLWNERYDGKILQFNNSRDAFGTALYYLGYSVNTTDHAKWNEALELLKKQKPLVSAYVMDEVFGKMQNGSAYIAPYYSGDFLTMYDVNDSLAFYYPEEGTNFFVDAMCIPTCAKNVDAAHEYINFMLSKEAAIANAEYIGYGSPNNAVRHDPEYIAYMEDWHEDAMDILYGYSPYLSDYEDLRDINVEEGRLRASFYRAIVDTEENGRLLTYTNELWSHFKSFNSIEPWIVVTDIVIVGALAFAVIFFYVRKKRREKYYS